MQKTAEIKNVGHYYHQVIPRNKKKDFINTIAERCGVHMVTVYSWINGVRTPGKANRDIIIATINEMLPNEGVTSDEVAFGAYEKK